MLRQCQMLTIATLGLLFIFPIVSFAKPWKLNSDLSCSERDAVIDRMAQGANVEIKAKRVEVGEKFSITWSRDRFPEREPVYLMISFDQPVRFSGNDLYGLLPDATAGFDISWEQNNTRAVIPFYGRGVPKAGKLAVEPIQSGSINIKWAVVGHNGCDERIDTPNQGSQALLSDTSGKPQIVVNDPDNFGKPKVTYVNADGSRHLQIFEGRFRLLDATTGAEILNEVGVAPYFSPAGRYVVIPLGDEAGIYDSVDGAHLTPDDDDEVKTLKFRSIIWGNKDSFTLEMADYYGIAEARNFPTAKYMAGSSGDRITNGHHAHYKVDLENNAAIMFGNQTGMAVSLTGKEISTCGSCDPRRDTSFHNQVTKAISKFSAVTDITLAHDLDYHKDVGIITRKDTEQQFLSDSANQDLAYIENFLATRIVKSEKIIGELALNQNGETGSKADLTWRSTGTPISTSGTSQFNTYFEQFDLQFQKPIEVEKFEIGDPNETIDFEKRNDKSIKFAKRISSDIGKTSGIFEPLAYGCLADDKTVAMSFSFAWNWEYNGNKFWLTNRICRSGSGQFQTPTTYLFSTKYPSGIDNWWGEYDDRNLFIHPDSDGVSCKSHLDACGFEIKVFGKFLLLYSSEARGYAIIDTDSGELITKQFDLPRGDLFDDILLANDGKHTVSLQQDGSFFINRILDAKTVLSGRYADDEVIVWSDDGRYDATAEGAHFVSYKFPGHFGEYTAQQFEEYLKVPGLAQKVMAGTYTPSAITITPPPVLRAQISIKEGNVDLEAEAKAYIAVKNLSVFQDGLLTDTLEANGTELQVNWKQQIKLLPGTKWISLVAIDENNVASAPYGLEIPKQKNKRNIHIFSTGVNTYDHAEDDAIPDLGAAVADAQLFTSTLSKLGSDTMTIAGQTELLEHEASPQNILSELEKVATNAKLGDTIAFYFAGHGVQGKDDKFYLATSTTDENDIEGTSLAFDKVATLLKQSKARIVIFLDACHSGVAGQGLFSTNDDVVDNVLQQIPSGVIVFAAAKGREFALEDASATNSFFARALADVIDVERTKHDANNNGSIELSELFKGVKSLVVNRVQDAQKGTPSNEIHSQTPWMARNRMVGDFSLF